MSKLWFCLLFRLTKFLSTVLEINGLYIDLINKVYLKES